MIFDKKDFLGIKETSAKDIMHILQTADTMKYLLSRKSKKSPYLQGKSVVMLFYEKSSRTRVSYELAAQYLSANVVDVGGVKSVDTTEPITDIGRIIEQMGADFIIIRHPTAGTAKLLAQNTSSSVINAGDGLNENPSQTLMDLMTIKDKMGGFDNLRVTMVGDIVHSRVARSNIWGLSKLGAKISVSAPPTLIPAELTQFGVEIFYDVKEAVVNSDVIMVFGILEERHEINLVPSFNEYKNLFRIDNDVLNLANKNAIVMHPGRIKRDVEISSSVLDSVHCLANDQITNSVAVRMALLYLLSINVKGGAVI